MQNVVMVGNDGPGVGSVPDGTTTVLYGVPNAMHTRRRDRPTGENQRDTVQDLAGVPLTWT